MAILEANGLLAKYLGDILPAVKTIADSFKYCSTLIAVTEDKQAMAKALKDVVQEKSGHTYQYDPSGNRVKHSYKSWRLKTDNDLRAASLFLSLKKQPPVLLANWFKDIPTPRVKMLSFLKTAALEFDGKLKIFLKHSYYNFDPVDDLVQLGLKDAK